MSNNNKNKPSLTTRLKAWWHGYEVDDVVATESKSAGSAPAVKEEKPKPAATSEEYKPSWLKEEEEAEYHFDDSAAAEYEADNSQVEEEEDDYDYEEMLKNHIPVKAVWDTERAHVAQMFWGDGYCGPGGPDNIINMTAELRINSRRTTMVLGGGVGGPVRAIQKEYDTEVDGYEPSEQLAKDGMEMSEEAGVADMAPIIHHDLAGAAEFNRSYDRVYAKEALFTIEAKDKLIDTIANALKEDGVLLLTDYIATDSAKQDNPLFQKWKLLEPFEPLPVKENLMESLFSLSGLTLKSKEDLTGFYLHLMEQTREHARKVISTIDASDETKLNTIKYMHNEAVLWDTRLRLLQKGDLKVMKYICAK